MPPAKEETHSGIKSLSYAEASAELEGIVSYFESSEIDIDKLVANLERATALIEELDARLRATQIQVESLVPKLGAIIAKDGSGEVDEEVDDLYDEEETTVSTDDEAPGLFA